jgi:glycosyltransferase involved in cell wall biosynthesis
MTSKKLKVLHINKFHHVAGGAEAVYFRTAEILERHGHSSVFFAMNHPNNLPCKTEEFFMPYIDIENTRSLNDFIMAICRNLYSFKSRRLVSKLLDIYPVDIVHIHDIHRQMSPSILHEFKKRGISVVMTLHNYKMICPSFIMMSHGKPCEACDQGKYFNAVKYRCVKGSVPRSALLSLEQCLHHRILDIYGSVDIFIAPSMFLKKKHEEMGFRKMILHLPYPLDIKKFENISSPLTIDKDNQRLTFIYFGRIEPEKGLYTLFESIRNLSINKSGISAVFNIVGEGPISKELHEIVRKHRMDNVKFFGFLKGENLFAEIRKADVVILPSEWYENYPVSVMEAFAMGRPVIGARIGGIPEMVKDYETGLTFESGNSVDLSEKIKYLLENPHKAAEMGKKARLFVEREINIERHYEKLMDIYRKAAFLKSKNRLDTFNP